MAMKGRHATSPRSYNHKEDCRQKLQTHHSRTFSHDLGLKITIASEEVIENGL